MGFLDGVRTGATLSQTIRASNYAKEDRARDQKREDLQMQLTQRQLDAYDRELQREQSEYEKKASLHRLAMESAYLNGAIADLADDEVLSPLYLEVFNEQERDRIDPMGDGRKVTNIDQMEGGQWAFEVSGGAVQGRKPVTRHRGTAAEGDNIVDTVSTDELIHDHLGRRQAFEERYGQVSELLDDPKALMKHLKATRDIVNARMRGMGGTQTRDRHQEAMELEGARQTNRLDLENKRHSNTIKRLKTSGGSSVKPPTDVAAAQWLMQNVPGEGGKPLTAEQAWDRVQEAKHNPDKFIESYVLGVTKSQGDARPNDRMSMEEIVQAAISTQHAIASHGQAREQTDSSGGGDQVVIEGHPEYGDVTEADIQSTMEANNMTREQVLEALNGG